MTWSPSVRVSLVSVALAAVALSGCSAGIRASGDGTVTAPEATISRDGVKTGDVAIDGDGVSAGGVKVDGDGISAGGVKVDGDGISAGDVKVDGSGVRVGSSGASFQKSDKPCSGSPTISADGSISNLSGHCAKLVISSSNSSITFETADEVVINGSGNLVAGKGAGKITVTQNNNGVEVASSVDSVKVSGSGNNVATGGATTVENSGANNAVS